MSMKKLNEIFTMDSLIDYYGITTYIGNCGYILPDGTMLEYFRGKTVIEHYEVEKFYMGRKCKCLESEGKIQCVGNGNSNCRYSIRNKFLFYGAVRCIPGKVGVCNIGGNGFHIKKVKEFIEHHIFQNGQIFIEINKFFCKENGIIENRKNIDLHTKVEEYSPDLLRKIEAIVNA